MLNLLVNIAGLALFILVLGAIFFVSFYVAIILLGVFFVAYGGLKIWSFLIQKKVINPRPGYPVQQDDVIDVEFTRVDNDKIEKQ